MWAAIRLTGSYPEVDSPIGTKTFTLHELIIEAKNNRWGPIIIFPEVNPFFLYRSSNKIIYLEFIFRVLRRTDEVY